MLHLQDLIKSCWLEDPTERPKSGGVLSALDTLLRSSTASKETASFLERRTEWTGEIEAIFDELKQKETNLSTRESQLNQKEQQLMKREQSFNNFRRLQRQASYDINLWTLQEVTFNQ